MRKNTNNESDLPLTISSKDGLVDQISYFNKTVASKDMSGYYLLMQGEFAYNKSYSVGYDFGSIKRLDRYPKGALSTLYICFELTQNDSDFMKVYFDSLKWYKEIYMIAAEGARNHGLLNVPTDDFFDTKHTLPADIREQQKIAQFMILLEKRIEKQRQLVEALKSYKRGALSKLFPQNGKSTPQYRFAGFTDLWEQRKLIDEVFSVDTGKSKFSLSNVGEYEVLGSTSVIGYDSSYDYEGEFILTARVGANAGELYRHSGKVKISDNTVFIQGKQLDFIYYALLNFDIKRLSFGTGQPLVKASELKNQIIRMPISEMERESVGAFFRHLDHLITLHQRKLSKFEDIKAGLLQQLFI